MIDNACKINPVGDLYATLDEAREAAQTFAFADGSAGRYIRSHQLLAEMVVDVLEHLFDAVGIARVFLVGTDRFLRELVDQKRQKLRKAAACRQFIVRELVDAGLPGLFDTGKNF